MAVVKLLKRNVYKPISTDLNLRARIQSDLDNKCNLPKIIPPEYPDRGNIIEKKVRMMLAGVNENPIIIEQKNIENKVILGDTLCVLGVFGSSPSRLKAQKKAIDLLLEMNPIPKIILVEGSVDGNYNFEYIKKNPYVDYIGLDLTGEEFRHLFVKEQLWNVGAHAYIDNCDYIKYLVFLDADTFFVDRYGWNDIHNSFNFYDIISPYKFCYYTGSGEESKKYLFMPSKGYQVKLNTVRNGYQGFGIGCTVGAYNYYFNGEFPCPSLGFGDVLIWYMLTGKTKFKSVTMLPYCEKECFPYVISQNVSIGCTNQILGHIDHGRIENRWYKPKCQLMRMCIQKPLSELQRSNRYKYILNWADTDNTKDLRWTYEHLLIENRREIQISTFEEAKQFYEFLHGCGRPPLSMRRNVFTKNYNNMPNWECSIQGPDPV